MADARIRFNCFVVFIWNFGGMEGVVGFLLRCAFDGYAFYGGSNAFPGRRWGLLF